MAFTNKAMAAASQGENEKEVSITRLDKAVMWNLLPLSKKYQEIKFDSLKAIMAMSEAMPATDMAGDNIDMKKYDWKVEINGPSDGGKINGFSAKSLSGIANGVNKENPKDRVRIEYSFWLSTNLPGFQEMDEYYKTYAKMMGLQDYWEQQDLGKALGEMGDQFSELMKKVRETGGYPVKMFIKFEKSEEPGEESGESKEDEKSDEDADAESEENEGAAMAAEMMKQLGLMPSAKPNKSADGMIEIISVSYEVVKAEQKKIADAQFEIPAGYSIDSH
jgi:hypothetical protein